MTKVLGLCPLSLQDVKLQENGRVAGAVGAGLGPVWFMGGGGCARQMRALVRTLLLALCWMLSWSWKKPVSLVILIAKRASRLHTGRRLAQYHGTGLT